ncbi:hypothetical protein [Maribacter luteus]|uniref:hypothetical protein n=1 Tax=Maribacter luteus TaxID=2594478 RepID=UPI00249196C9|nr:hypothetical protein [Maribacter luteus]
MRTLLNSRGSAGLEPKENTLVHRLERNLRDVNQLRKNLNSYNCEPQTYNEYTRIEALKNGLDTFKERNKQIIDSIKKQAEPLNGCIKKVKEQYSEFNALKSGVEEYMGLARSKYTH